MKVIGSHHAPSCLLLRIQQMPLQSHQPRQPLMSASLAKTLFVAKTFHRISTKCLRAEKYLRDYERRSVACVAGGFGEAGVAMTADG
jgi:hypothetical protein